jgi:hypothetical protein
MMPEKIPEPEFAFYGCSLNGIASPKLGRCWGGHANAVTLPPQKNVVPLAFLYSVNILQQ